MKRLAAILRTLLHAGFGAAAALAAGVSYFTAGTACLGAVLSCLFDQEM